MGKIINIKAITKGLAMYSVAWLDLGTYDEEVLTGLLVESKRGAAELAKIILEDRGKKMIKITKVVKVPKPKGSVDVDDIKSQL